MIQTQERRLDSRLWQDPAMRQLLAISFFGFSSFFLTLSAVPLWASAGRRQAPPVW